MPFLDAGSAQSVLSQASVSTVRDLTFLLASENRLAFVHAHRDSAPDATQLNSTTVVPATKVVHGQRGADSTCARRDHRALCVSVPGPAAQ